MAKYYSKIFLGMSFLVSVFLLTVFGCKQNNNKANNQNNNKNVENISNKKS